MTAICLPNGEKYPRENSKHWIGRDAEDVPPGWMDDMVRRVLEQLNRRLIKLEDLKNDELEKSDTKLAERNSIMLSRTARDLERYIKLETMRSTLRTLKAVSSNEGALAELIHRIDRIAETLRTDDDPSGSEQ